LEREIGVAFDGILQFDSATSFGWRMSEDFTIFIVDDDEAVRDSLKLLLESHGCRVKDYGSTRDFFRAFRPGGRQCLVLDQHLPDETGLDFLESDDGATLRLPIILVTGGGDRELRNRAARAGAKAYFDKPLNDSELVATILRLLDRP
jgi:two-component system, LuxR family, response regulator FixJ